MHSRTIPVFTQFLGGLAKVLAKADAHVAAHNIAPEALLTFRLYPDMLNFTRQVQLTTDFSTRCMDRLTGREVRSFPDTETGFAELIARVEAAQAYLATFTPAEFTGAGERMITLKMRSGEMTLPGEAFLENYSRPQFFFHLTTAYDILRHNGVVLGKRDFMGAA
mgnify:CR=1 FL=1